MSPSDFNKVTELPIGLGLGKLEHEITACQMLNRHIDANQPFDQPFQYQSYHQEMVSAGWLAKHGERQYTLTKKAIGILWGAYGK